MGKIHIYWELKGLKLNDDIKCVILIIIPLELSNCMECMGERGFYIKFILIMWRITKALICESLQLHPWNLKWKYWEDDSRKRQPGHQPNVTPEIYIHIKRYGKFMFHAITQKFKCV